MEIEKFESLITSSFGTSYGNVPKGMKSYFDKPIQIKISANIIEKEEKWKERRRGEMKNEKEKQKGKQQKKAKKERKCKDLHWQTD